MSLRLDIEELESFFEKVPSLKNIFFSGSCTLTARFPEEQNFLANDDDVYPYHSPQTSTEFSINHSEFSLT